MYEENDPYSFGEEARAEYEQAGTRLLIVPPTALTRKDGRSQWSEFVTVTDIQFIEAEKALKNPEQKGDLCFGLNFTFDVAPESQVDGQPTRNSGRRIYSTARYNMSAYKREKLRSGDFRKGQASMTQRTNGFIKSLLLGLGMDTDLGLSPKRIVDEKESFIGQKVWAKIVQGKDKNDYERTEVDGFIPEEA